MTKEQKIQAIKIVRPEVTHIEPVENDYFMCTYNGEQYKVEVYQSWDTIHVAGFCELADRDKCLGACRTYENYIAKSKRKAGLK